MANIVLVHGAWHGGWCYRYTAAALRKMGHEVSRRPIPALASALIRRAKTLPSKPTFATFAGCRLEFAVVNCRTQYGDEGHLKAVGLIGQSFGRPSTSCAM